MASIATLYDNLPLREGEIRLLKVHTFSKNAGGGLIQCSMHVTRLAAAKYKTLSYAWGPEDDMQVIVVDGYDFKVRRNLFNFLGVWVRRQDSGDFIWIDQLCINQDDLEEKAQQVTMMGNIFSRSEKTFAWLGVDCDDGIVFAYIKEAKAKERPPAHRLPPELLHTAEEALAIEKLCLALYFSRHWTAQQVILGTPWTLLYGSNEIDAHDFEYYCVPGNVTSHDTFRVFLVWVHFVHEFPLENGPYYWWPHFTTFATTSYCQDPRDKVFGLQNVFKPELQLEVNYKLSTVDVFLRTVAKWQKYETCE